MIRYEPWVQHNLIRDEGRLPAPRELTQWAPVEKTAVLSTALQHDSVPMPVSALGPSLIMTLSRAEDPAKQQLKKSRESAKKMDQSSARVVKSLRDAARQLRHARS